MSRLWLILAQYPPRVAIADGEPTNIIDKIVIDTTTPDETLGKAAEWLEAHKPFAGIGVASFGPVDLDKKSPTYGYVTTTPKPNWGMADVLKYFKKFDVPIEFDTDVNAPALAEQQLGNHGYECVASAKENYIGHKKEAAGFINLHV